ncbi:hypothetical protein GCM10023333_41960 [Ferrimonas pelagia]|uniref:DUF4240 domain-containing protein n=2 Tax=Ferrimonas pelagia TaxID=1177826 RepID=A0ABP9FHQ3_9GAMM
MADKAVLLARALSQLPDRSLLGFSHQFELHHGAAYTWRLWGAAYLLCDGCSEEEFANFRASLISCGPALYQAALDDPNVLSEVGWLRSELCSSLYHSAVTDALEQRFGRVPASEFPCPLEPSGQAWEEETLPQLYPRLKPLAGSTRRPWWQRWLR